MPSVTLTPRGAADTQPVAGYMLDSFCSDGSCVHPGALSRVYRCDSPPHPVLEWIQESMRVRHCFPRQVSKIKENPGEQQHSLRFKGEQWKLPLRLPAWDFLRGGRHHHADGSLFVTRPQLACQGLNQLSFEDTLASAVDDNTF